MARLWTENQKKAIETRGGALIVSAAAGSGKTAVLTERAVRMICDETRQISADRLLIVTYTKAAAAELKVRLNAALAERISENPSDPFLKLQQSRLEKAHISTIHSFCQSVVKEHFYALGIDRNFRIADESELSVIRADAMRLTLDGLYAEKDEGFLEMVENFASPRDDSALSETILNIYDFLLSHPFPKKWMREKLRYYDDFTDIASSVWGDVIRDYTADTVEHMQKLVTSSLDALSYDAEFEKTIPLFESDDVFVDRLAEAVSRASWDGIKAALGSFETGKFVTPKGFKDHPMKKKAEENRKEFKKCVASLSKLYNRSYDECLSDIRALKVLTEAMFNAVSLFSENFSALKNERGAADFSDLEHWMLQLLVDGETGEKTELAVELSQSFDEIMVDEFQDANETQDTLFKAISDGEKNLFVVGDVKQSIYGFRQAMPELFLKRKNNSRLYEEAHPAFPAKIILEKNFRSAEPVIEAVNFFFEKLMSPSVGDIDYNDEEKLFCGAAYEKTVDPAVELDIVECPEEGEDVALAEAGFIAERIMQMISEGYLVKDRDDRGEFYRPATYADFAILMRTKKRVPLYVDLLEKSGVRATSAVSHSFLDAYEVMLITNFLRVINNPLLDIELLSVMMCPVFAFSESDLARIRLTERKVPLYRAVLTDAENGNEKSRNFLSELTYYRSLSATVGPEKLIRVIYDRSSFLNILSASLRSDLPGSNLRLFLDHAREFEQRTAKGLSSFVFYLDRVSENRSDLKGAVSAADASVNAVNIMSIHASKGLEFPVVFVADTGREFNFRDIRENVLLHSRLGMASKRLDRAKMAMFSTMPREALALEKKRSMMSEELRVLYVALTRAKQKLIMTAAKKDAEDYIGKMAKKLSAENAISPYLVRTESSIADWITMCVLLHPDAKNFRDITMTDLRAEPQKRFDLSANIIRSRDLDTVEDSVSEEAVAVEPDESVVSELLKHESFVYPYEGLLGLPVKVAASELAHRMSTKAFDRILPAPAFMSEKKLSAADRGTALHAFMQHADFRSARADVASELSRLLREGYLTEAQAESIDLSKANSFLRSHLVERCLHAEKVLKEYRFNVEIPARVVDPAIQADFRGEPVILQGAVDLTFVEDGELVVVDYKTDRVKTSSLLLDMYSSQLLLYKDALEQCLKRRVKECLIYSIHLNEEVNVPLS